MNPIKAILLAMFMHLFLGLEYLRKKIVAYPFKTGGLLVIAYGLAWGWFEAYGVSGLTGILAALCVIWFILKENIDVVVNGD